MCFVRLARLPFETIVSNPSTVPCRDPCRSIKGGSRPGHHRAEPRESRRISWNLTGRSPIPQKTLAFKPRMRPILFHFFVGVLLLASRGARCQLYADPVFTPANMNGNGTSFVSLPGYENYTWTGWCRIYTDPCSPRVKLENMLEGTFINSSSPEDPPSKVTWSMEGHAHVGPCSNPGGHWQQNKSKPGDE